jgi:hypothetical protein
MDKTGKAGLPVLSGELKTVEETLTTAKRVFNPHDLVTVDVLSNLITDNRIHKDLQAAPHGGLVMARGTLVWMDRHMLELSLAAVDLLLGQAPAAGANVPGLPNFNAITFVKGFLAKLALPSAFLLLADSGFQVAGTIKDEGLEEPITTYYFKHGTAGLSDVHLVGIKEVPSPSVAVPGAQLLGVGQQAAQGLSDLLFPKDAFRVTPVALFRKL